MSTINSILAQASPFLRMVAWIFAILGAWICFTDLVPILKQVVPLRPTGDAQKYLIAAACLSLVSKG